MGYLKVLTVLVALALPACGGGVVPIIIPPSSAGITCLPMRPAIGDRVWVPDRARYATVKDFPIDDTGRCAKRGVLVAVEYDTSSRGGLESSVGEAVDLVAPESK